VGINQRERSRVLKEGLAIERLMNDKTVAQIAGMYGVGKSTVTSATSKFGRFNAVSYIRTRKQARNMYTQALLTGWGRSEELRNHMRNLKKWHMILKLLYV